MTRHRSAGLRKAGEMAKRDLPGTHRKRVEVPLFGYTNGHAF